GCRPRGIALPWHAARDYVCRPGRPTPWPRHAAQRGGDAGGGENSFARSAQQHGPDRPRSAGVAALRTVDHRRSCPGARNQGKGSRQAISAGLETPQGHSHEHARRSDGVLTMSESNSGSDPLLQLAEEFAERFRRGERPALTEYTDKHPELAEQIRDLFPAMVVMEEFGSVGGPATGPYAKSVTPDGKTPQQLGEYRILREVARGGMGIVYEAVQESLGRHVALKVLPAQSLLNSNQLERFRREARAAANLHHTNTVPVFGVGEADGIHYYAMQFIQGQSLDNVLHELKR